MHLDETAFGLNGSVEERHRAGRVYLYDKFRIGTEMKSRYLGESSPELRTRLAKAIALYRAGVLVQIPRPERFAIHKLTVADRRRGGPNQAKAKKDRGQAEFLIEILAEDRPDDIRQAYADALSRGPRWRERIDASLIRMPRTSDILRDLTRQ